MTLDERNARRAEAYKLGLNDTQSAKLIGESPSTYSNWRRREGLPLRREYKQSKMRDSIKFGRESGIKMAEALPDPEQQEKINLFLRLVARCRPKNVTMLIAEIHNHGFEFLKEAMR